MKNRTRISIVTGLSLIIAFLFSACSGTQSGKVSSANTDDTVVVVSNPISLTNMLRRVPGVFVDETGAYPQVLIRGGRPLFVVDGIQMGHNFYSVESAINVNDIAAIEVLKNPTETLRYGRAGQNGVILIHTGTYDPDDFQ